MRYKQVFDGEWVKPKMKGYLMQCCGCKLTHKINFKIVKYGRGKSVMFQAFRLKRRKKK